MVSVRCLTWDIGEVEELLLRCHDAAKKEDHPDGSQNHGLGVASPHDPRPKVFLVGGFNWWLTKLLWKIWKSVGMMTFPIYWKIKHVPNHKPVLDVWTLVVFDRGVWPFNHGDELWLNGSRGMNQEMGTKLGKSQPANEIVVDIWDCLKRDSILKTAVSTAETMCSILVND